MNTLELLHKYASDPKNKELEVRLYIDPRQKSNTQSIVNNDELKIKNIVNKIISSLMEESNTINIIQTIEFIREHPDKSIRSVTRMQIRMPDKKKIYMRKKTLYEWTEYNTYRSYKISVSEELDIPDDKTLMKDFTKIRIKLRLTIVIRSFPDWKYDITFVKTVKDIANLQQKRNVMLPLDITPSSFIKKAPYGYEDHIEIEAEYIGDNPSTVSPNELYKVVNKIYSIVDPGIESTIEYQNYLNVLATIILGTNYRSGGLVLKKLYNSVKELSEAVYFNKIWPIIENWWVTDKADGQRCLIIASESEIIIISDYLYLVKCKKNGKSGDTGGKHYDRDSQSSKSAHIPDPLTRDELTIVDAEIVYNAPLPTDFTGAMIEIQLRTKPILFTFDVIMIEGKSIVNCTFGERIKYLDKATNLINKWCAPQSKQLLAEVKQFVRLTQKNYAKEIFRLYKRSNRPYEIDGLIFTPDGPSKSDIEYNKTNQFRQINTTYKNMDVWKWKPIPSIDFLIRKPAESMLGKSPYIQKAGHTLYFLFSGINRRIFEKMNITPVKNYLSLFGGDMLQRQYFPIQFTPSSNPMAYLYWHPNNIKPNAGGKTEIKQDRIINRNVDNQLRDYIVPVNTEIYGFDSVDLKPSHSGKSEHGLDKKIGEFRLIIDKATGEETWKLMKIRTDRTKDVERGNDFGNDFIVTAERIWDNFHNPLLMKDLIITPTDYKKRMKGYFKEVDSSLHRPQRSFNSFVKNTLWQEFRGKSWVVDMGGGKGQDLFRYASLNMHNVLFLDIDARALSELLTKKRIFYTGEQEGSTKKIRGDSKMGIYAMEMDLNKRYDDNITRIKKTIAIPKEGVPLVICSFTFHYLMKTGRQLENAISFIDGILAIEGHVVITTYDGESIFNLMKKYNGHYKIMIDGRLKYSIKANYSISSRLSEIGQTVDVLLPFSSGEHYEEPLVNMRYVIKRFKRAGFQLVAQGSFSEFLPKFKGKNKMVFDQLTDEDKAYVSLYQYFIAKKLPKKTRASTK